MSTNVNKLKDAYDTYGPRSSEFYKRVEKFLIYLQMRYLRRVDEDLTSAIYIRLMDSFAYYDSTRVNIASWVFSVARNQISTFIYEEGKRKFEPDEKIELRGNGIDYAKLFEDYQFVHSILNSFKSIRFDFEGGNPFDLLLKLPTSHPLIKEIMWQQSNSR